MADTTSSGVGISWGTKEHSIAVAKLSADSGIIDDDVVSLTTTYSSSKIESEVTDLIDDSQTEPGTGTTVYSTEKMLAGDLAVDLGAIEVTSLVVKGGPPLLRLPLTTYTKETFVVPMAGMGVLNGQMTVHVIKQNQMVIVNCEPALGLTATVDGRMSIQIPVTYLPSSDVVANGGWLDIVGFNNGSHVLIAPGTSSIQWSRLDGLPIPFNVFEGINRVSLMWYSDF